ncbi:hypothetical protein P8452_36883 [Trifolium repens]|nr:hypothetical protein P8452_36883 [Trifolium repens]
MNRGGQTRVNRVKPTDPHGLVRSGRVATGGAGPAGSPLRFRKNNTINSKVQRTERIERHGVSWLTFSKWRKLFFSTLKVLGKLKLLQMEQGDETMARMTSSRQGSVQQHRSCNRWRYSIDGDVVMVCEL